MTTDHEITDVLFRWDVEFGHGEVTAVFPYIEGSPGYVSCYAHIGQHGSCSRKWYVKTRPATSAEYADLKTELESIGYKLRVIKRWQRNAAK